MCAHSLPQNILPFRSFDVTASQQVRTPPPSYRLQLLRYSAPFGAKLCRARGFISFPFFPFSAAKSGPSHLEKLLRAVPFLTSAVLRWCLYFSILASLCPTTPLQQFFNLFGWTPPPFLPFFRFAVIYIL